MCGKFTQLASWSELVAFSQPLTATRGDEELRTTTPMRFAYILRLGAGGKREVVAMRWGFADKAAGAPDRPKHMHARCETIDQRPTFAAAFAQRRGILLTHTFNEGEELASGKTKQWTIRPRDGLPIAIAVICEDWARVDASGREETLSTFVMVTTPANALIVPITDRMPAILPPQTWPVWLGETGAPLSEVKALLKTFDDGGDWEMAPQEPKPRSKPGPSPQLF